jgi:hypothetical protein
LCTKAVIGEAAKLLTSLGGHVEHNAVWESAFALRGRPAAFGLTGRAWHVHDTTLAQVTLQDFTRDTGGAALSSRLLLNLAPPQDAFVVSVNIAGDAA